MAKVKVRRASRDELPGLALLRESIAMTIGLGTTGDGPLDLDMEIDPVLDHLMAHDPDGFLVVVDKQETLGFAAAIIRSRQCILSEIWVLPQHRNRGAGEALLSRCLAYGERSGAREYLTLVGTDSSLQSLLLRHGLAPQTPVYRFSIPADAAVRIGGALSRLLEGCEVTSDLLASRGQADVERLDRLARGALFGVDQDFWLKKKSARSAFVNQGARVAAYAFGGTETVGPVVGSTQDAVLSALGWALTFSTEADKNGSVDVWVPAPFTSAIEALLDGGARITATHLLYSKNAKLALDRWIPAGPRLP